jgi:predicted ester cyclase
MGTGAGQTERNKQAIRDLLRAVDDGEIDRALSYYDPDYVDHDASEGRSRGSTPYDSLRVGFRMFGGAFSRPTHTIEDLLAEGDKVVARIAAEATHAGPIFGIAGTGRRIRNDSIVIYRLRDGRIVERWCRERRSTRELLIEASKNAATGESG